MPIWNGWFRGTPITGHLHISHTTWVFICWEHGHNRVQSPEGGMGINYDKVTVFMIHYVMLKLWFSAIWYYSKSIWYGICHAGDKVPFQRFQVSYNYLFQVVRYVSTYFNHVIAKALILFQLIGIFHYKSWLEWLDIDMWAVCFFCPAQLAIPRSVTWVDLFEAHVQINHDKPMGSMKTMEKPQRRTIFQCSISGRFSIFF